MARRQRSLGFSKKPSQESKELNRFLGLDFGTLLVKGIECLDSIEIHQSNLDIKKRRVTDNKNNKKEI